MERESKKQKVDTKRKARKIKKREQEYQDKRAFFFYQTNRLHKKKDPEVKPI